MAVEIASHPPRDTPDELDDLFDYDPNLDDIFGDNASAGKGRQEATRPNQKSSNDKNAPSSGLGIDEEITIVAKRQPIAKLDESRLLSELGIPKLRKIAKKRKNFRGKGHEYSDVSKVLAMYQLWLDELYPRAKFNDGLVILEKLGHSKRMQVMRKQWIDEGKPRHAEDEEQPDEPPVITQERNLTDGGHEPSASGDHDTAEQQNSGGPVTSSRTEAPIEEPDEDELDALFAEEAAAEAAGVFAPPAPKTAPVVDERDEFEDDMEVMAEMW